MLMPSILSVSLLTIMAPTAISPALAAIREAFPQISATQAKLVLTLPTLIMMPLGLYSARLTARIDKKKLLLVGMTLFLVFGVAGGFVNDFRLLLLMRVLFGIGLGIMTPLSTSLIFDFAPDPGRRSKLLGIQGASNQLGGLVFMSLSGVLANISWRYSFLCYAFVIVSIVLTTFFLPSIPPLQPKESAAGSGKQRLDKKLFILAFFAMMIFACYFVINTDLALFMDVEGIGDAEECGYALSLMRIPAILAGVMLAWIMRKLKDWTMSFASVIMAAGYLIIAASHSYGILMVGCLIVGLGGGFALPPISLFLPRIVTPRQRTLGVAIIMSVAQLITTIVIGLMILAFARTLPKKPIAEN